MPIAKCQPLKPTASTKTTLDGSATTAAINRHLKFQDQTKCFFAGSLFGDRDGNNKVHPKEHITFPYFYLLPKVHKVPLPDFNSLCAIVALERRKLGCRDYATRRVSTERAKRSQMKQNTLQIKGYMYGLSPLPFAQKNHRLVQSVDKLF
jgi:hypothetical protein